ncbi:unannotated protein [freshwater metagenome]|uniref:Unannotated protein n=1 Tax=freshwater metagenome TaxID=449393 RepID=A0A6J7ISH1_9ZZZZ|nr:hypothetical protein [Actinomycetota bacterium]
MAAPVLPQFRPTLADLVGPRWRALPRAARIAAWAAGGLVVALLVALAVRGGSDRTDVVVARPVAFTLSYDASKLVRATPEPGASLLLRTPAADRDPERFSVRPVTLPQDFGTPGAGLPLYASRLIDEMRRADPAFVLRGEGRARINGQPGYQILFQTVVAGDRTAYGRRTLLFKDDRTTDPGADITILAVRSLAMPNVDAVGSNGPTKLPYRSFRLGVDGP